MARRNFIGGQGLPAAAGRVFGVVGISEAGLAANRCHLAAPKKSGYGHEGSRYGLEVNMHIKHPCQGKLA